MAKKAIKKKTAKKIKTKFPVKLAKYLDGVKHEILEHKTVYTAIDAASTMRRKLNETAKTLLVKADRDYYLIVLPADRNLDFKKLGQCIGGQTGQKIKVIKIPSEKIMEKILKVKAGTMSAFGGLHKLPVVMDKGLTKAKKAVFASGSFNHSVEMAVKDFIKLENALLGSVGVKKKVKLAAPPKARRRAPKKIKSAKKRPAKRIAVKKRAAKSR